VFRRINCPHCARLIAVNRNGQLRTHFCPHRHLCEPQRCRACERQLAAVAADEASAEFELGAEAVALTA
jgi:hypothetical protein